MKTMTETKDALQKMLAEPVGSITDSGGYGGRAYTKYVGIDWDNIPQKTLTAYGIQHSLYHHLLENLIIEPDLTKNMHEKLDEEPLEQFTFFWGDFINNYCASMKWDILMNWHSLEPDDNSNLNGNFSALVIEDEQGNEMVIIQTHNGMDYRMGWSTPYVFSPRNTIGVQDSDLFRVSTFQLCCQNDHRWWSDDGNEFSNDGDGNAFSNDEETCAFNLSSHCNDDNELNLPLICPLCNTPMNV